MRVANILKRHSFFWLSTLATVTLVALIGILLINDSGLVNILDGLTQDYEAGFLIWRLIIYLSLICCWPLITSFISRNNVNPKRSRIPIIALIFLYEFVIVQNPLAWIFTWVG